MNYGLYLSAGGALSSMYRQDVHANNLANMNTTGFKPDRVYTRERLPERVESGRFTEPQWLLERLGGGHYIEPTETNLAQGDLVASGRDLDLALEGEGLFAVRHHDATGVASTRLTRDGRLTLNGAGDLVTVTGGLQVLDAQGQPIRLDSSTAVRVDQDGTVFQNESAVAQLKVVDAQSDVLVKVGGNLFKVQDPAALDKAGTARVHQGFTEASAVDPILTLNAMMDAAKAAQANLKMMQYHDQLLGQAFNTFGRVA